MSAVAGFVVKSVIDGIIGFIDGNVKDKNEAERLKKLVKLFQISNEAKQQELQVQKILTEMKGNWLQRSWRPIVMIILTVAAIVLNRPEYFELIWKGIVGYVG